jgi:hypothetical protein
MPDSSKYNFPKAEKVQVFEHVDTYIEHNHTTDENLKQQIKDLSTLVKILQTTHRPTTETGALTIINAEFREIQTTQPTRWQVLQNQLQLLKRELLNPEQHLSASKATLSEVAKHYLEDSVIAKAVITYLDTLSATPDNEE